MLDFAMMSSTICILELDKSLQEVPFGLILMSDSGIAAQWFAMGDTCLSHQSSLVKHTLLLLQHWMYCITSTRRESVWELRHVALKCNYSQCHV